MTRTDAVSLFHAIQNGRGTGDLWDAYKAKHGVGTVADYAYDKHMPEFTLGLEYGILIALALAFDLQPGDV